MKLVVAAVVALSPAIAHADALRVATADLDEPPVAPPGMTPVVAPVLVVVDQEAEDTRSTIDKHREVAGSQRHMLSGTALTVPQGQVEVAGRTAIVVNGASVAAGLTSSTEVWADFYTVLIEEGTVYGAGIKQVLARGDSWQLAATAGVRGAGDSGDDEVIGTVGGVLSMCSDNCTLMASGGVQVLLANDGSDALPIFSGGLSMGSPTMRLVIEGMFSREDYELAGIGYLGVRFGSRKTTADLGLARLFDGAAGGDSELIPVPLFSLATRM